MTQTATTDPDDPTQDAPPDPGQPDEPGMPECAPATLNPHPEPTTAGLFAVGALIAQPLAETNANGNGGTPSTPSDPDDDDPKLDPSAPVSGLNPWRAFRINPALATQYAEFNANAIPFLSTIVGERLKTRQPVQSNLEAANALLVYCQTRKIEYPRMLLKRVKQMQAARSARP